LALRDANITALTAESRLFYMSLIIKEYLDKDTTSRDRSWGYPEGTDLRTPMEGAIRTGLEHTGINIEELLAYERRIAEISEHTEVDFSSDIKRIKNRLREAIKVYNFYADAPEIPGEKISLDKFKPDKKTYKYLLQLVPTLPEKPEEGGY